MSSSRIAMRMVKIGGALCALASLPAAAQTSGVPAEVAAIYPDVEKIYLDLHGSPELSNHETQTAQKMAAGLKALGFEVTTGVGGTGVVGVLKNGAGPTVMLRTELDALPVTEATGLAYASTVRVKDASGADVGVMHACGHDVHMSSWLGTARIMAGTRTTWKGTLILIGQPAEELGSGARAMIADGLLTRFPRPDYALAVHDDARTLAGEIAYRSGAMMTNADSVNVTIYGRGGHGARPDATVDPVVIAARTVLALQTIVSRENSPFDPAVITVGSIHGGTKNNIIPDEVKLQLTVRSFTQPVRQKLLAAIDRIVKAEAQAAAAPKEPLIEHVESANALVNDPALTQRVATALTRALGTTQVREGQPEMASEDFSEFGLNGIPSTMLRVGAAEKGKYDAVQKGGAPLPSLHSALFAPDREPAIKAAMEAEVIALRMLLNGGKPGK